MKVVYFETSMWTLIPKKIGSLKIEQTGILDFKVKGKPEDVDKFLGANNDRISKITKIIEDDKVEKVKEAIESREAIKNKYNR